MSTRPPAEKVNPAMILEGGDLESAAEIRALATQRVEKRMQWKPSHPMEEEIFQLAIRCAEHFLLKKREQTAS